MDENIVIPIPACLIAFTKARTCLCAKPFTRTSFSQSSSGKRRAGTDHQKPGNITVGPVSPACAKSSQLQAFCNEAIWVSQTTCQSTTCRCVTTCHLDCCTHNTPCGTRTRNLRIRSPTPCPLGQGGLLRCDKHH